MPDAKEVPNPNPNAKAGYDFDPYSDPAQLGDIHNPNIPFHNYRQIHVSEVALGEGFRATSIKEIPRCPPLWQDIQHYWDIVSLSGYLMFEFGTRDSLIIKVVTVVGSIGGYQVLLKPILAMFGVHLP
jgi:hypothetical protein